MKQEGREDGRRNFLSDVQIHLRGNYIKQVVSFFMYV
jgi:hypothetical protein